MLLALWNIWNWVDAPAVTVTRGGVSDWRAYRKQLKKIAAAADKKLYKEVQVKIEKIIEVAPLEIKQEAIKIEKSIKFEFNTAQQQAEIQADILSKIAELDLLLKKLILQNIEAEEETIFILLMA